MISTMVLAVVFAKKWNMLHCRSVTHKLCLLLQGFPGVKGGRLCFQWSTYKTAQPVSDLKMLNLPFDYLIAHQRVSLL